MNAPTGTAESAPRSASRAGILAAGALRGLVLLVLPGLLALLMLRYFVPTIAEAHGTRFELLARAFDGRLFPLGILLFLVFSLLARYWGAWIVPAESAQSAEKGKGGWKTVAAVAIAVLCAVGLRMEFGFYRVLSASMLPTLEPGDYVGGIRALSLDRKKSSALSRGDLLVFQRPEKVDGPDLMVKRVMGLPGDLIRMNGSQPVINGWNVPQCDAGAYFYPISAGGGVAARLHVEWLNGKAYLALYAPMERLWTETYRVKPGEVFLIGDNRTNSVDSRAWDGGKGAGLPITAAEAKVGRWLFGYQLDDHVDLRNVLRGDFQLSPRLPAIDTALMRDAIARCLASPPKNSTPPGAP